MPVERAICVLVAYLILVLILILILIQRISLMEFHFFVMRKPRKITTDASVFFDLCTATIRMDIIFRVGCDRITTKWAMHGGHLPYLSE